jgi:hypothetical protein
MPVNPCMGGVVRYSGVHHFYPLVAFKKSLPLIAIEWKRLAE